MFFKVNASITLHSEEVLIWSFLTASEANIFNFLAIIPQLNDTYLGKGEVLLEFY